MNPLKNTYISDEVFKMINSFTVEPDCEASKILGFDKSAAELYEKLNPVLSNGHRCNPISVLRDPRIPQEVSVALLQFVQQQPPGTNFGEISDKELLSTLPSRYMQSPGQLDEVRRALVDIAESLGVGVPESSDNHVDVSDTPADSPSSADSPQS